MFVVFGCVEFAVSGFGVSVHSSNRFILSSDFFNFPEPPIFFFFFYRYSTYYMTHTSYHTTYAYDYIFILFIFVEAARDLRPILGARLHTRIVGTLLHPPPRSFQAERAFAGVKNSLVLFTQNRVGQGEGGRRKFGCALQSKGEDTRRTLASSPFLGQRDEQSE